MIKECLCTDMCTMLHNDQRWKVMVGPLWNFYPSGNGIFYKSGKKIKRKDFLFGQSHRSEAPNCSRYFDTRVRRTVNSAFLELFLCSELWTLLVVDKRKCVQKSCARIWKRLTVVDSCTIYMLIRERKRCLLTDKIQRRRSPSLDEESNF